MEGKRILDSWKEIAAYLKRSEKTCRHWVKELGLPVRRLEESPKARVFAYADELDRWLEKTGHSEKLVEEVASDGLKKVFLSILGLAFLIFAAVVIRLMFSKKETLPANSTRKSIAVLPFEDLSSGKGQEALADGIPETLINALSRLESVFVSARTSSFSFKGNRQDIRDIGRKLGVKTLLEGSVQVEGDELRILVRLINIEDGFPIWSEKYNKTVDDVFVIQDDIAQSVVKALKIKLLGEKQGAIVRNYTANREAYNLYLQGRYFWEKRSKEDLERAISLFDKAIGKDTTYALAYSGIADCYYVLGNSEFLPPNESFPKAITAARKALEIDNDLAEAHVSLAAPLGEYNRDSAGAEREFKIAIELNPGYATAHQWFAWLLSRLGRHDEAIKEIMQARELDPLSPRINNSVGLLLYFARRYDQAIEELEKSIGLFPQHAANYGGIGQPYALAGRYKEAIRAFNHCLELQPDWGEYIVWIAYCYALSGNRDEAQKRLKTIIENSKKVVVSPIVIARVYLGLGDKEQAFIFLDKAFLGNAAALTYLKVDPSFDSLRSDPRFTALLRKIGFEE